MSKQVKTVRISAVESVQIEAVQHQGMPPTVKLAFVVGGAQVLTKHITTAAASQIGDALADAVNALRWPA